MKEITDTDFRYDMHIALHITEQTIDEYEVELMNRFLAVISKHIDELRKSRYHAHVCLQTNICVYIYKGDEMGAVRSVTTLMWM